jgi:hypothetical protein
MALGLRPGAGVDRETMRRTFDAVLRDWDLRQTWGWDFPMMAMTAARLGLRDQAVDLLLRGGANFRFGVSGMTPRGQLEAAAAPAGAGGAPAAAPGASQASYRPVAETYFPSNGALLWAVGLMAGGWDGAPHTGQGAHPGFPDDGRWVMRSEGLRPLP